MKDDGLVWFEARNFALNQDGPTLCMQLHMIGLGNGGMRGGCGVVDMPMWTALAK